MNHINYYEILGISINAEESVIRAAYKALAQKYHPDKYQGDKDEAFQKMRLLNEAYDVLSDTIQRQNYDANFHSQQKEQTNPKSEADKAWELALEYHPEMNIDLTRLALFSDELAEEYKIELLKTKQFNEHKAIAKKAEQAFLEDYFGSDHQVTEYARGLILQGKKQAVKELNEALMTLGESVENQQIIDNIDRKYRPEKWQRSKAKEQEHKNKEAEKEQMVKLEGYVHIKTASEIKGIDEEKLIQMIRDGFLQGVVKDGEWYIHEDDVSSEATSKRNNELNGENFRNGILFTLLAYSVSEFFYVYTSPSDDVVFMASFFFTTLILLSIVLVWKSYKVINAYLILMVFWFFYELTYIFNIPIEVLDKLFYPNGYPWLHSLLIMISGLFIYFNLKIMAKKIPHE
jgi:curved DNA-binding protein CbpA